MAFDRRVSEAIDIIYIKRDFSRGAEAFQMLIDAANQGDGDAHFFLGRVYAGSSYVDSRFHYPEDDDKVVFHVNKSMELGSAVGMFGARRFGGLEPLNGTYIHAPYHTDREIWDAVVAQALEGDIFCEMLIANAYYWGDAPEFLGLDISSMPKDVAFRVLRNMALTAIDMYEDLFTKGMFMPRWNYHELITSGDWDIKPDKKKLSWFHSICQQNGYSV